MVPTSSSHSNTVYDPNGTYANSPRRSGSKHRRGSRSSQQQQEGLADAARAATSAYPPTAGYGLGGSQGGAQGGHAHFPHERSYYQGPDVERGILPTDTDQGF